MTEWIDDPDPADDPDDQTYRCVVCTQDGLPWRWMATPDVCTSCMAREAIANQYPPLGVAEPALMAGEPPY